MFTAQEMLELIGIIVLPGLAAILFIVAIITGYLCSAKFQSSPWKGKFVIILKLYCKTLVYLL